MQYKLLISFSAPAVVMSIPIIPIYLYLPTFYGIELQLGLASTGVILMLVRAFDTITDPIIGVMSDRSRFQSGRRKPWIAVGAIIASVGLYKLLIPSHGINSMYLFVWCLVLYTGWTMVMVPYLAWGAEITDEYSKRTSVTSWREGFGLLGVVCVGIAVSLLASMNWSTSDIMQIIALVTIALGLLLFPILLLMVPENRKPYQNSYNNLAAKLNIFRFLNLFNNKLFLRLLFTWFMNGLANGIPASLFLIYLNHVLGVDDEQSSLFILIYFLMAIISIPVWFALSKIFGKHKTWCFSMILACLAFAAVPILPQGAIMVFAIICVITGIALGADLILPPAIQADVVDYDRLMFKTDRVGQQFSLWSMATKLALAIAVGFSLSTIDFLGFDPKLVTEEAKMMVSMIYAWVPTVIKLLLLFLMWNFPLNVNKLKLIQKRLAKKM